VYHRTVLVFQILLCYSVSVAAIWQHWLFITFVDIKSFTTGKVE